jgi:hypothetical protein
MPYAILYQEAIAMQFDSKRQQHLTSLFAQQPCWMIVPLATELGYSVPSTRRFLGEAGYYSSFTHNGRWYTLCSIPRFGRDGLWFYEAIGFSRIGSLTGTLVHLVGRSPAGMTAQQLGEKLRCRCHSVLVQLCRCGKLARRKLGGSHIYLAADPSIQAGQLEVLARRNQPSGQVPAEIAVFILAEFIRCPDFGFEQLAETVSRSRGIALEVEQIEALFALHGLKKTTRPAMPEPYGP